jgi:hypothetical protein
MSSHLNGGNKQPMSESTSPSSLPTQPPSAPQSSPSPRPQPPPRLSDFSFNRPIPRAVRRFGYALDPNILQAGDLLLVGDRTNSWTSRRIVSAQSNQFPDEHAYWHHAAVCGGGFEIVEATFGGVKCYEYWDYMTGDYDLKVRRLRNATDQQRSLIAYYAATSARTAYGFFNIPSLFFSLAKGNPWGRSFRISRGVVCSQLYFEACMRVGFLLNNIPPEHVCPAHLSQSALLEDLKLAWVDV